MHQVSVMSYESSVEGEGMAVGVCTFNVVVCVANVLVVYYAFIRTEAEGPDIDYLTTIALEV